MESATPWRIVVFCGVCMAAASAGVFALYCHRGTMAVPTGLPRGRAVSLDVAQRVKLIETAKDAGMLQPKEDVELCEDFDFNGPVVNINSSDVDQEIMGFGGAFTEASAVNFKKLSPQHQEEFLEQYFGESGIGYSIGRVHINSCDFSKENYNFDNKEDWDLLSFDSDVEHDNEALIPLIKRAAQKAGDAGRDLRLLASPWSPPAWMKTNGQMDTSDLPNGLKPECYGVWAQYISKWISAYKNHAINIRWLTVQNEPMNAPGWEACAFSAEDEANFLGYQLGPVLQQDHPDVGIFAYDDSKHNMYAYAEAAFNHGEAKRYVEGVAFHWYTGDLFENVASVHRDFPHAKLLPSEATYERRQWEQGREHAYSEWRFGEGYAHDIIGDLNAGAVGWMDWNLLLDFNGGPNHVGNVCDAAIVSTEDGMGLDVHPQYYYIGHFSKYLPVGSIRLGTTVEGSTQFSEGARDYGTCTGEDGLQATAFKRPDGQIAVVVLNCGDDAIKFKIREGKAALKVWIPPHAIQTYLLPSERDPQSKTTEADTTTTAKGSEHPRDSAGISLGPGSNVKAFRQLSPQGACCFASEGGSPEDSCKTCLDGARAARGSSCAKSRTDCLECSGGSAVWCPIELSKPDDVMKKHSRMLPLQSIRTHVAVWQAGVVVAGTSAVVAMSLAVVALAGRRRTVAVWSMNSASPARQ